jgi:hypothetical protein
MALWVWVMWDMGSCMRSEPTTHEGTLRRSGLRGEAKVSSATAAAAFHVSCLAIDSQSRPQLVHVLLGFRVLHENPCSRTVRPDLV